MKNLNYKINQFGWTGLILTLLVLIITSCNKSNQIKPELEYKEFNGEFHIFAPDSGSFSYSILIPGNDRLSYGSGHDISSSTSFNTINKDSTFYKKSYIGFCRVSLNDNMLFNIHYKMAYNSQYVIDTIISYQFHEGYNIVELHY